jgi:hypothetical protein
MSDDLEAALREMKDLKPPQRSSSTAGQGGAPPDPLPPGTPVAAILKGRHRDEVRGTVVGWTNRGRETFLVLDQGGLARLVNAREIVWVATLPPG